MRMFFGWRSWLQTAFGEYVVMEMKSLIVANLIYAVIYDKFKNLKLKFYKQKFALKIK